MGMLTGQEQPQQQSYNPTTAHGKYNGVVDVNGQKVQVSSGNAQVEGQPFFVSDNGAMVLSSDATLVGYIENSKFKQVTPEYLQKMRSMGYVN